MEWETVIGLEVHTQLKTNSKIFSGASTAFGAEPNTQACAIDLGLPGVLPVLNKEAVLMAVRLGLAIGATVAPRSIFARKNYFYPDLPKGYQISQYELPIVHDGSLTITDKDGTEICIGITRAHLEEDAGKSLHEAVPGMSGIDLNRAGTPLLEIVSEPDLRSSFQAAAYMRKLHGLVRYLGICDGNMQEGSLRCDANVSVRPKGQIKLGTRAEIKNLNSFRFVERAIDYEVERQIDILENGGTIKQETRLYDSDKDETRPMRSKEEANDYRYFPDPDLLPVEIDAAYIESVRAAMPELPEARLARFQTEYGLSAYDAEALSSEHALGDYFEQAVKLSTCTPKLAANWVTGDLTSALNHAELAIEQSPVSSARLAGLLKRIEDQTLSLKLAKDVFQALWESSDEADAIIAARGLKQITDESAIEAIVDEVIATNPEQAEQFRQGKDKVLAFLVGQAMRASKGKANPGQLNALFMKKLAPG